jgi:hypothetical protein
LQPTTLEKVEAALANARQGVRDTTAGLYESLAHVPQQMAALPGRVASGMHLPSGGMSGVTSEQLSEQASGGVAG